MSEERVERRLTAILAADVVGYSRLMGADEEGTLAALKAIRRELVDPRIVEHRGRIVKTTGDGLLVEFASIVDAVRCAVDVQREMAERDANVPAETRIEFRIGINLGDIIIDGDDIFGDGVNVTARLETLAEPGGICVSHVVRDQVRDKLAFAFEDLGDQQVKNIARPIRAYRIARGAGTAAPASAPPPTLALPDKPSLVVLPFQNMSGDPEQEYFADGMVEEITTAIARLPWLFVIACNSAFTYKGRAVDVKQVAQELGVRYVLEGSVRKAGQRVRITGQLIDAVAGSHIWVDRFDGALDDVIDLQDQVASRVVAAIEPRLRQSESERTARKPTRNLDVYDLYLRALAQSYRYTDDGFTESVVLLRQALAIDPSYAPAAALVGWCRAMQRIQGWGALSADDLAEAVRLARQALEMARDDPDVMRRVANTLFFIAGEVRLAASIIERALALNPNAALAWVCKGTMHALQNQPEAAIEACERAQRLNPYEPQAYSGPIAIAIAHLAAHRFELAVEWADRTLHQQPRNVTALRVRAVANAHLGRLAEAQTDVARALAIDRGCVKTPNLVFSLGVRGDRDEAFC